MAIIDSLEGRKDLAIYHRLNASVNSTKFTEICNDISEQVEIVKTLDSDIEMYYQQWIECRIRREFKNQRIPELNRLKEVLARTMANEGESDKVKMFDRERVTREFRNIGHRFVALDLSTQYITLSYVRPARMLRETALPVPPLFIQMQYSFSGGAYVFRSATASSAIKYTNTSYIHPHTNGYGNAGICLGNFLDVLRDANTSLEAHAFIDHVIMMDNLLATYNSDSPYVDVSSLCTASLQQHQLNGISFTFETSSSRMYILNQGILDYMYEHDTHTLRTYSTFTINEMASYYRFFDKALLNSVLSDMIDSDLFETDYDDGIKTLDNARSCYNLLTKLGVKDLKSYNLYIEHNYNEDGNWVDDDDMDVDEYSYYDGISEGGADILIKSWKESLVEFIESKEPVAFDVDSLSSQIQLGDFLNDSLFEEEVCI
jgi:hypothetical protein